MIHDHSDAEWRQLLLDHQGDLMRQPLLHLQPPRKNIHQAWNLAETDHLRPRDVRDVTLAEERQQVVLAETIEVNVLDDHHLAVIN